MSSPELTIWMPTEKFVRGGIVAVIAFVPRASLPMMPMFPTCWVATYSASAALTELVVMNPCERAAASVSAYSGVPVA